MEKKLMRLIVHGQQAYGKSVLEAILEKGVDEVVAVYSAPDKEGRPLDPLKEFALEKGLPVFQPESYKTPEVWDQLASHEAVRIDTVSPVVAAMAQGAEFDQLADHHGQEKDRPVDLLAG
jgi:methionyl-tRNA formyltransferase